MAVALLISLSLSAALARGDGLTGLAQDDPKEMGWHPSQPIIPIQSPFLPLPGWSRSQFTGMPPLPDVLKPLGKKTVVASTTAPATNAPAAAPVAAVSTPKPPPPSTPKPPDNPALVAVSPFLQWIKDNPQAAANDARHQAETYQAASAPTGPNGGGVPGAAPVPAPYWMPPLVDPNDIYPQPPVTGSAAIYSTPQR